MIRSATEYHFAILAILCTLAIFFFPAVQGPYPATHGPATDFETVRGSQLVRLAMALVALALLARTLFYLARLAFEHTLAASDFAGFLLPKQLSILRC